MTDKEIIVDALEHCVNGDCGGCPNLATEYCSTPKLFYKDTLDLINRQQAEIEKLERAISYLEGVCESTPDTIRAEAIKEFAERLKEHLKENGGLFCVTTMNAQIDNIVKEMNKPSLLDKKFGGEQG